MELAGLQRQFTWLDFAVQHRDLIAAPQLRHWIQQQSGSVTAYQTLELRGHNTK
jgi:hypothetical protein